MAEKATEKKVQRWNTTLEAIEGKTGRSLSLRTRTPLAVLRVGVNRQRSSRLLSLPTELRLLIYEFVFHQYEDEARQYKGSAPYRRPGYAAPRKTDTTLLLTCRRVWLEANHLPLQLSIQAFWFYNGPLDLQRLTQSASTLRESIDKSQSQKNKRTPSEPDRYVEFFKSLTPLNFAQLNHVHIFASQAWVSTFCSRAVLDQYFDRALFTARKLTFTIRDGEWGAWKSASANGIDTEWLREILGSGNLRDLQEFRLELELNDAVQEKLDAVAGVFAGLQGKFFKRSGEIISGQWTKCSPQSALPTSTGADMEKSAQTVYSTRTISWKCTKPRMGMLKHPRGFLIQDGELQNFRSIRQKFLQTRARKRGGRRSLPSMYRNHWKPQYANDEELKQLEKQDTATNLMESWTQQGSLLRLV